MAPNVKKSHATWADHDEFAAAFAAREQGAQLAEVLDGYTARHMSRGLSQNQKIARAWFSCNGDVERQHCTGVYVRPSRGRDVPPVVGVYVDSPSRVTDFRANKELYLARLAHAGVVISDIEFKLSRTPKKEAAPKALQTQTSQETLPELTLNEEKTVASLVQNLPDSLKTSVSRAISISMRRKKLQVRD